MRMASAACVRDARCVDAPSSLALPGTRALTVAQHKTLLGEKFLRQRAAKVMGARVSGTCCGRVEWGDKMSVWTCGRLGPPDHAASRYTFLTPTPAPLALLPPVSISILPLLSFFIFQEPCSPRSRWLGPEEEREPPPQSPTTTQQRAG